MTEQLVTDPQARHRLIAVLAEAAQASPTLRAQLDENGLADYMPAVSLRVAGEVLERRERHLIALGFKSPMSDNALIELSQGPLDPAIDFLEGLRITRGEPVPAPAGLSLAEVGKLLRLGIDSAVAAAVRKPARSETVVDRTAADGTTERTLLTTEHRVLEP
jgi:hypothetical protein